MVSAVELGRLRACGGEGASSEEGASAEVHASVSPLPIATATRPTYALALVLGVEHTQYREYISLSGYAGTRVLRRMSLGSNLPSREGPHRTVRDER